MALEISLKKRREAVYWM